MQKHFSLPSFLAGIAVATALAFTLGAASKSETPVGRFQIDMNENHVFILDTINGQAWEKFVSSGSGSSDPSFGAIKLKEPNPQP